MMRAILLAAVLHVAIFLGGPAAARADTLVLADGRVLTDVTFEKQGDLLSVELGDLRLQIPADRVVDAPEYVKGERWRWPNRAKAETEHLRFESTVPPDVFARYRDDFERFLPAFCAEWGIEIDAAKKPLVFIRLADGPEEGVVVVHDSLSPRAALRAGRRALALEALRRAWPDRSPAVFPEIALATFAAADGAPDARSIEALRPALEAGKLPGVEKLESEGWGWSYVWFLLSDPGLAPTFRRWVRERKPEDRAALSTAEVVARWHAAVKDLSQGRVRGASWLPTSDDIIAAARAAGAAGNSDRMIALYRALIRPHEPGGRPAAVADRYVGGLKGTANDWSGAIAAWQGAIRIDPLDYESHRELGRVLERRGAHRVADYHTAIADEIEKRLVGR